MFLFSFDSLQNISLRLTISNGYPINTSINKKHYNLIIFYILLFLSTTLKLSIFTRHLLWFWWIRTIILRLEVLRLNHLTKNLLTRYFAESVFKPAMGIEPIFQLWKSWVLAFTPHGQVACRFAIPHARRSCFTV